MEATNVASCGIVREPLTRYNYEEWKTLMENYLRGKNLLHDVQSFGSTEVDARRNAEALHIIQLTCGSNIFQQIKHIKNAREAWRHLGEICGSELKRLPDIEQGGVGNHLEYGCLFESVIKGDWTTAETILRAVHIKDGKDLICLVSTLNRTVLHVATMAGHVDIVDKLVKLGSDILVEARDQHGYTALALAAHYTGDIEIAKCMVKKRDGGVRENLLAIRNEDGEIPLLLAADKGHKHLTRYLYKLYSRTLWLELNEQETRDLVLLLERCIKAEIFDVALQLLERYRQLLTESLSHVSGALRKLAQMPSAYLSGCQFGLPQKIIYDSLRVENKCQNCCNKCQNCCGFASTAIVPGERHPRTNFSGRFCRPVLDFLLLPVKLLGRLLLEIVNVFAQFFIFLNILGIREIYEQKRTHYQVLQILRWLKDRVATFNNSQLNEASVYEAMLDAAKHGIVEFINAMTEANHELLWAVDGDRKGIFSYAVLHRKQNVFRLIHTLYGGKAVIINYSTDMSGNNLLHLAGHLGPLSDINHRPGAVLQMQREIQWFKAVEEIVNPTFKEAQNDVNKKPHELFTEKHVELVKAGEAWAKKTAESFTIVGTLITTIMFAAAFTVPGGNNQDTGVPILLNERIFTAFVVADAMSLFTSATSILIFIEIQTSRFTEIDFLKSLPLKLLFGLVFLSLSVVSMMIVFCAALAIVLKEYWAYKQLILGGAMFGSIPVFVLVPSQLRLMLEIFRSTISNPIR